MDAPWVIQLFGGLRARQAERLITRFRTQQTGALLAYLAYHRHQSHSREALIERFWPDSGMDTGRHNLSNALSSLRNQLEPPGVPGGAVIIADRFAVELNPDALTTDVAEFERAVRVANQARNAPEYGDRLAEAADRFGGVLLPHYYDDWIAPEQERLLQRFHQTTGLLIGLLEKERQIERALDYARRALAQEPLREESSCDLMRLLASAGRFEEALSQYRDLERLSLQELGERPTAAQQLARQIEAMAAAAPHPTPPSPPTRTAAAAPPVAAPTLPTGTVTFLFSDIEGSTALYERTGDAFRDALSAHHALLRSEFRRVGGIEVKEAGDSFLVAFTSASDALTCSLSCQRALAAQPWPEAVGTVKIRMALHSGDVELDGGEYRGLMLHHAARILSAAHGGQILVSEAAAGLLRRNLEPGVRLTDLGVWRLRDVEEPERLFQAEYPGQAMAEFPPLNARPAHTARLPLQFTRFFGRTGEIDRIGELLASPHTRLLTLTGPGGTGKSRLAIEAIGRLADTFPGRIWFVPLADLSDPRLIGGAILGAMGVPESPSQEPLQQVVAVCAQQPTLLLLDNFEQVVAGGAEVVQTLLERLPDLRCVVTSRQVLGLPGELEFAVPPLPTPNGTSAPERLNLFESVRLFVDRAQASKPDFRVTNSNAADVAELCDRLEGLPLAIELAAARALVLTPAQMLTQLGHRFEFLVSRKRGVTERQRTLRAAVDWSYKLLSPEVQRFFVCLSVFRGGWTTEAAEVVCEEPLALDFLAQLRECSLVATEEAATGIRFRMLETLREYAQEQAGDMAGPLAGRHAAYYRERAETAASHLTGPEPTRWLTELEAEHNNLRACLAAPADENATGLRLAVALWRFWSIRGHAREGLRTVQALLARTAESAPERSLHALALDSAGALAHDTGDYDDAARALRQSLAYWRETSAPSRIAHTLNLLANVLLDQGRDTDALPLYEEALTLHRALGEMRGTAMVLSNLSALLLDTGQEERAALLLQESLSLKRTLGNHYSLAISLENLGNIEARRGDYPQAADRHREALALRRELGHREGVAMSLNNLGHALLSSGRADEAAQCLLESLRAFQELEDGEGLTECLMNLAGLVGLRGDAEAAARIAGGVAAFREARSLAVPSAQQAVEERLLAPAREKLGEKTFARQRALGRKLSLQETILLAQTGWD